MPIDCEPCPGNKKQLFIKSYYVNNSEIIINIPILAIYNVKNQKLLKIFSIIRNERTEVLMMQCLIICSFLIKDEQALGKNQWKVTYSSHRRLQSLEQEHIALLCCLALVQMQKITECMDYRLRA